MAWLQAAACNFGQHRSEQERVRYTDERDAGGTGAQELVLQAFRGLHAGKSSAEDNDAFHFFRRARSARRFTSRGKWSRVRAPLPAQTERGATQTPPHHTTESRPHPH